MATRRIRTLNRNRLITSKKMLQFGWYPRTRSAWAFDTKSTDDYARAWETENPFISNQTLSYFPTLTGTNRYSDGSVYYVLEDVPITYTPPGIDPMLFGELDVWQMQAAVHEGVLRSTPNKEHMNVPSFVGELKDIPDMVRLFHQPRLADLFRGRVRKAAQGLLTGDFLSHARVGAGGKFKVKSFDLLSPKLRALKAAITAAESGAEAAGGANLWWRFGLAPLLSDLASMGQFLDAIRRRLNALLRMRDKGTYRKHVRLGSGEAFLPAVHNVPFETATCGLSGYYQDVWRWKRWVSIQWTLDSGFKVPKDFLGLLTLAHKSLYGMSLTGLAEAAWELTPWSWLVDWFAHLDDLLKSLLPGVIPCHVKSACFMQTTRASRFCRITSRVPDWLTLKYVGGQYGSLVIRKRRVPVSGLLASLPALPSVPVFTSGQWGILGSLIATKGRHGRHL